LKPDKKREGAEKEAGERTERAFKLSD